MEHSDREVFIYQLSEGTSPLKQAFNKLFEIEFTDSDIIYNIVDLQKEIVEIVKPYTQTRNKVIQNLGGTLEDGLSPDDPNYQKAVIEIGKLQTKKVTIKTDRFQIPEKSLKEIEVGICSKHRIALEPFVEFVKDVK